MDTFDLPEFEDMYKTIEEIRDLATEIGIAKVALAYAESEITKLATSDGKYFQNGKPPSQTYIDNTYKYQGFDSELIPMRMNLAKLEAQLAYKKASLDLDKLKLEVWRTQSANERVVS
jgi:hypothetical protein